jgi:hypothetical protein
MSTLRTTLCRSAVTSLLAAGLWGRLAPAHSHTQALAVSAAVRAVLKPPYPPLLNCENYTMYTVGADRLACRAWYGRLVACATTQAGSWDWRMTPACHAKVNDAEVRLGAALHGAGLAVEAQVGVSPRGGRRRGGWYANWWLDYAHRDPSVLLKIDIELDGWHHRQADRTERDEVRNQTLQRRGW